MLEDLGLKLAHAKRFDESIAAFERAIELGWHIVPDGRCEIARVLLLAGGMPKRMRSGASCERPIPTGCGRRMRAATRTTTSIATKRRSTG
jgi:hypothetical protein